MKPKKNPSSTSPKNKQTKNSNTNTKKRNKTKQTNKHRCKQKNIQLLTVAPELATLDCLICYRQLTLSLTTVNRWAGVMCEVVTPHRPQRQVHDPSSPLALLLWNLGLQACNAWKLSEQTQFSYKTGATCGVFIPKDDVKNDKTLLQNHISVDPGNTDAMFRILCYLLYQHYP